MDFRKCGRARLGAEVPKIFKPVNVQSSRAHSEEHSGEGKVSVWSTTMLCKRRLKREEIEGK